MAKDVVKLLHRLATDKSYAKNALVQEILPERMDLEKYLGLTDPVLSYLLADVVVNDHVKDLDEIVLSISGQSNTSSTANEAQNKRPVSALIFQLVTAFPPDYISRRAEALCSICKVAEGSSGMQAATFRALGERLCEARPTPELCLPLMNSIWKNVRKLSLLEEYLSVADVFVEMMLQTAGETELSILLKDINKQISSRSGAPAVGSTVAKLSDKAQRYLDSIVTRVASETSIHTALSMPPFVSIIDSFTGEIKAAVNKQLLSYAAKSENCLDDPNAVNYLLEMAQQLHDSLDIESSDASKAEVMIASCRFASLLEPDGITYLSFLVDCRGKFHKSERIRIRLIQRVNALCMQVLVDQRKKHKADRLASQFAKACIAFSQITIPSIAQVLPRVQASAASDCLSNVAEDKS
eukprot:scaffold3311_cov411-Prasinococcus_capsulatus_cf.AAC.17